MTAVYILACVLLVLAVVLLVGGIAIATAVAKPKRWSTPDTIRNEAEKGFLRDYDALPKEAFCVTSFDGYELNATYIPCPGSHKFVILSHGHTYTRYGSVKYLHLFRRLGYHAVIYDDRAHGDNRKAVCTMGIKESRDLAAMIDYIYGRFGHDVLLGLHGESLGGALTLMALRAKPKVAFVICDCAYARLEWIVRAQIRRFHLPMLLFAAADTACRALYGYRLSEANPMDGLAENTVPICFIHGAADAFTDRRHSEEMAKVNGGYTELHLIEGADHAMSFTTDEERYNRICEAFIKKVTDGEV